MSEQIADKRSLQVRLNEWLRENNVRLTVRLQTPQGESITPYNFIPQGWPLAVDVVRVEQENK